MAMYFWVFPAPDAHIDFILQHPETLSDYVQGSTPKLSAPVSLKQSFWQRLTGQVQPVPTPPRVPDDWPATERTSIGPEINHRNVDQHHYILNGTAEPVSGGGSIFQTWFLGKHAAIELTGEDFAFKSNQLRELAELLVKVDAATVKDRLTSCYRSLGDSYEVQDDDCKEIAVEYRLFYAAVEDAIQERLGLIWVGA